MKVIIENFGPITERVEIDVKDFMVFTGEQASGKSTIAKVIWFFESIIKREILPATSYKNLIEDLNSRFFKTFGTHYHLDKNMYVYYEYKKNIYVEIKYDDLAEEIKFNFSENINQLLKKLKNNPDTLTWEHHNKTIFDNDYVTLYIPTGRSLLSSLNIEIENFLYNLTIDNPNSMIDFLLLDYIKIMSSIKTDFKEGLEGLKNSSSKLKNYEQINTSAHNILKGEYFYDDDVAGYLLVNNKKIPLNNISSGQQEVLWILNILIFYLTKNYKCFFIIEEPENSLFPSTQKLITEFIALVHNAGHQVLITTHSPYILGTLNNLLYAPVRAKEINNEEAINKIINKDYWLNKENFGAWFIDSKHTVSSCFDEEKGVIKNEVIDKASDDINNDFDKMLEAGDN
ncbi:MAG: ATP-binding protein [Spirochaetaceae bacterium]|nr:ATP-binding protein [Spirochaetaceae bacterium]